MAAGAVGRDLTSTERDLLVTVAALMYATGETQTEVGAGVGLRQTQISRRMAGDTAWSLTDLHHLAAHYGVTPSDLLGGADRALRHLPAHRRTTILGGTPTATGGKP